MNSPAKIYLLSTLEACHQSEFWLKRSLDKSPPPPYEDATPDDWDALEALASRFGRMCDLIINKLFRALDRFELEETGSLMDAANRAVQRGIIDSVEQLRDLKDIRNEIVHEYAVEDLPAILGRIKFCEN
jgi:hypothetical protein